MSSTTVKRAFQHIGEEYGPPAASGYETAPSAAYGGPPPGGPPPGGSWAPPVTERFSATRAYDKLLMLSTLALGCGIVGYLAVPPKTAYGFMIVAFVIVIAGWFRMRWARYLAPVYAVVEGLALGSVSALFASLGHGIVLTAIVFTAGVFFGALICYRTGLVRVTPRMMSLAFMGALGILAVGLLSLIGVSIPGIHDLTGAGLVFSVLALGIAVLNLFTDFEYVRRSEALGLSAEGEWAAAFAMLTAIVLVYISMLRILGAAYGGGRRR